MKNRIRNVILLIVSMIIYISLSPQSIFYILFSGITTFLAGKYFSKEKSKYKKAVLVVTIVANASILVGTKILAYLQANYQMLQGVNIFVSLGLAYYTLQVIGYVVDVYKKKIEAEQNIWKYLLFVMYIPYLLIGPINRYQDLSKSLFEENHISKENMYQGILRVLWGMIKKFIVAGRVSIVIATIVGNGYDGAYALLAMLLYGIQLYADFSGGIDMVLGVSRIFGVILPENFDSPYLAQNVKEFWRRWHITLGSWLRDYIYIPLGGNRCSKVRNKINVIITFLVSGFWHGINYIVWGLVHGILVAFGNYKTKWKTLNRIINYLIISFTWCFFVWPNTIEALKMVGSVFTTFNVGDMLSNLTNLGLSTANIIVLTIFTIFLFVFDCKKEKVIEKLKKSSPELKTILVGTFILCIFVFGIYGIGFNVNEFIYSQF